MINYICTLFGVLSLLPASTFALDSQSSPTMRGVMSPTRFVASDFQALGQYKANLIRWQIMRKWVKPTRSGAGILRAPIAFTPIAFQG